MIVKPYPAKTYSMENLIQNYRRRADIPDHMDEPNPVREAYEEQKNAQKWMIVLPRIEISENKVTFREKKMGMFNWWVQKKELEIEVKRLSAVLDIERRKLQAEFDILATKKTLELTEHEKLYRMQMEDKLNKQCAIYQESLQQLKTLHAQETSKLESRLAKEYYDKMGKALQEVNLEGNAQSKFVQELSLKMFDKALEKPMPAHMIHERIVGSNDRA